jgi:organic hydroperoxide reductase OsmC/OhrA
MHHMTAEVRSSAQEHAVTLGTDDRTRQLAIPPKPSGLGSSANGAELLLLALATCYCNDVYREAGQRGIQVRGVRVEAHGDYDGLPGSPVLNIAYNAVVEAEAAQADILALMRHTDTVAEIQNTLRLGTSVVLLEIQAIPV